MTKVSTLHWVLALGLAAHTAALGSPLPVGTPIQLAAEDRGNGAYLNGIKEPPHEDTINEQLFDPDISHDLKERYGAIYKDYEDRRNYNLGGRENEIRYNDASKALADWTMHRMIDDHVRRPVKRFVVKEFKDTVRHHDDDRPIVQRQRAAEAAAEASKDGAPVARASVAGAPAGTRASAAPEVHQHHLSFRELYQKLEDYYNHGWQLDTQSHLQFQYDMPAGVMDLALTSGLLDTNLDYFVRPLDFSMTGGLSQAQAGERAQVSMRKSVSLIGVSTGVHYGLINRSLNYGASRQIVGPLSAAVDQSMFMSDPTRNETTYRLNFGVSF